MNLHDKQRVVLIVLCVPLLCMGTFAVGAVYGHLRMYLVNRDVFALAEQLGYTPDALLVHRVYDRDFNLFPPWDTYCEAKLFYTTPLDAGTFRQKVNQALPQMRDTGPKSYENALFFDLGITASDPSGETIKHGLEPFMARYYWSLPDRDLGSISLLETANMNVNLEYNGHRIQDNIVEIYESGGTFPIWVDCPRKTSELASSSK